MELTLEAYRNIVKYIGSRADIANLCRVSKGLRRAAERALYNTLFLRNDEETTILCNTLANSSRLAFLVDALTIFLSEESDSSDEDDDYIQQEHTDLPATFWPSVARALQKTTRLRYLNVHINNGSTTAVAWVLRGCTFQLRRFHCDFDWNDDLVTFLDGQTDLEDLYILDYSNKSTTPTPTSPDSSLHPIISLGAQSIPKLAMLECTFSEAAVALVPGRPITHLKTCFSRTEIVSKREEMHQLLAKVSTSTAPLRSLDLRGLVVYRAVLHRAPCGYR
ncbi:hypothetical protein NLJ89_g1516 [Agrocybe chaxingu]|uniref:F-box domain-containing protein n=1 Tax=Agrocybe chaxingu TaxID=84603 RepID=A0A9W8TE93_9AGAR|nr:hypothetical protein NLJ89_g1516 [Agrocybe chaxingu]